MKNTNLIKYLVLFFFAIIIFIGIKDIKKQSPPISVNGKTEENSLSNDDSINKAKDSLQKVESINRTKERELAMKYAKKHFRVHYDDIENVNWIYDYSSPKYTNYTGHYVYLGVTNDYVSVRFRLQYLAENWLFIEKVIFKIDEQKFTFIPEKVTRDNDGGEIWEIIDVDATSSDIQPIITALRSCKTAKVRFEGSEHYADRIITRKQIEAIKRMYDLRYRIEPI